MSPSDQINSGLISVRQRSSPCAFCAGLIKLRRLGDNVSAASQIREAALWGDRSASRRQAVTFLLLLGCPTSHHVCLQRSTPAGAHAVRSGRAGRLRADYGQTGRLGEQRVRTASVQRAACQVRRRNSFLTGGEWRSASLLRAKPFCLSTPSQASGCTLWNCTLP